MLQRLRHRAHGQEGFTLIELLVVILIIGILAAVAIPTFLSQTNKAKDSNVQSNLNTAQTTMETYYTSNQAYPKTIAAGTTPNALTEIEGSLTTPWGTDNMGMVPDAGTDIYGLYAEDTADKIYFDLIYDHDTGTLVRLCENAAGITKAEFTDAANNTANPKGDTADWANKDGCNALAEWGD